jgi:8-oxo-dGTP diphosphatase
MRAGVILTKDGEVALIERAREGQHYYTFPGGGMEDSESLEDTAIWEAQEELGLIVAIGPLVCQ